MIVRISGIGQFELDDDGAHKLDALDKALTGAYHDRQEQQFHEALCAAVHFVQENGKEVSHDTVLPSDVIMPPEDITLEDAHNFMTDEGLLEPVQA